MQKPPNFSYRQLDEIAAQVLSKYYRRYGTKLPIKTEQFLEIEYGAQIIILPGIKTLDIECGLSADGKTLLVDADSYNGNYGRQRFGFAHEISHEELHVGLLDPAAIDKALDPMVFLSSFRRETHDLLERQANSLGARIVMPEKDVYGRLAAQIVERMSLLQTTNITIGGFAQWIAPTLAAEFGVTAAAMRNRLNHLDYSGFTDEANSIYIEACESKKLREAIVKAPHSQIWGSKALSILTE